MRGVKTANILKSPYSGGARNVLGDLLGKLAWDYIQAAAGA